MRALICVAIALACVVTLGALLFGPRLVEQKNIVATDSTVRAVCSAVSTEISSGNVPAFETLDTPEEYDQFIMRLAQKYNLDAPADVAKGKPLLDRWGHRYKILIKDSGKYVEVVSAGPDGQVQSQDDVRAEARPK